MPAGVRDSAPAGPLQQAVKAGANGAANSAMDGANGDHNGKGGPAVRASVPTGFNLWGGGAIRRVPCRAMARRVAPRPRRAVRAAVLAMRHVKRDACARAMRRAPFGRPAGQRRGHAGARTGTAPLPRTPRACRVCR